MSVTSELRERFGGVTSTKLRRFAMTARRMTTTPAFSASMTRFIPYAGLTTDTRTGRNHERLLRGEGDVSNFFFTRETPVARKEHVCEMCALPIECGSTHSLEKGIYEGQFFARRLHLQCYGILDEYMSDSCDSEFHYDWIYEWLQERICYECACENLCLDQDADWRSLAFQCPRLLREYHFEGRV